MFVQKRVPGQHRYGLGPQKPTSAGTMEALSRTTFEYVASLNTFREAFPVEHRPSWVKITTITMVSKCQQMIDIPKIRERFLKQESITLRIKGSEGPGFTWKLKPTSFFNQVTLTYIDAYSTKSIKVFPNGSIQVAGCADLMDCLRVIKQLQCLLETDVPIDTYRIVMINTNFSLNYNVNLMMVAEHFAASPIFNVSFEPDRYSAVKMKFRPAADMKEVTASVFSTGKIIVTGAETLKEIAFAYNILGTHMMSRAGLKVSKTATLDVFETFMGYSFVDLVPKLNELGIKPWTFSRTNAPINF